jgi:hypothetical protein
MCAMTATATAALDLTVDLYEVLGVTRACTSAEALGRAARLRVLMVARGVPEPLWQPQVDRAAAVLGNTAARAAYDEAVARVGAHPYGLARLLDAS